MARTKIGGGRKRKVAAEAAAGASLEHSSKKHRSSEQSQDAGQAPALASKARSRFENPQVSSQDPQSHHFADGAKLQQPRQVGPRGGTPSPTSRGDSSNYSDSAVKYQVGSKFEPEGRPGVSDPARWKKKKMKAAKFIHSASGLGSTWIGKRPLGEGSFGITGLWEKYDADGEMTDQMVVKEVKYDKNESGNVVPEEVQIMARMKKARRPGVVRLINYRRYHEYKKHRIYMEFCPYGDLNKLVKRYRRFRQYLPEAFLWDTFHYLVEAAAAMQEGLNRTYADWEVVHRDIKPANIFLGLEDTDSDAFFPFYPVAKLGDWGLALRTYLGDPRNPVNYQGAGTFDYMAPEHSTPRSEYPNSHKMLAHTNVWEIGATMFELLTLERVNYYYKELGNYGKLDAAALIKRYPYQVLMTTILRCLEPEPVDRITIEGLQIIIRQEQESFVDPFAVQPKENSTNPDENDRLYYRGNEIENMPPGDWIANHSTPEDTKDSDDVYRDPSLSPLRYPVFEDESDGSDDNGESDGLDDEDEDLSTKTRLWNKYNKRPADDDRMFTEWKTSFVRKHQKGQEANPITLLSSKAASAGADPAGNDGVDGYRDVSNHAGSDGNPPSAPPARRLGSKRLLNNAAAQGSGALPNPFRPVWPIPGSSAARGGANASLEEGEFGEENGEDELQLPQLAPQGYSGLLRQAQAALGSVASSLGLTRRSEREQGDGGHGGGQAGAEDEDDGPHGPSSSSQMPTDEGEEGERMSVSSGPSPTFYQHGTHGDGTQSGSSSSQDENQPQAGSRAASAPNILPQQGDQAQQTDRRASSAHTTGSEVGVIRRDMYYAPQNPQPPYRQDVALLGMTGEMFNRSPTEMRPPREGEIVLDALVTSHRDAERSGDVATTQNLDRAYGRFFSFYQAAEDAGIGNVLGGLGEVFGMGRRVGWRDRR